MNPIFDTRQHLMKYQPAPALAHFDALAPADQAKLCAEYEKVNFPLLESLFQAYRAQASVEKDYTALAAPLCEEDCVLLDQSSPPDEEIHRLAADYLEAGKLAVVLLAGGVGSRLDFSAPKGMFPIAPVTGKTLFEIHFEKIRHLEQVHSVAIRVYLMTSSATHDQTVKYLAENDFFGMPEDRIFVFRQGEMPAFCPETGALCLKSSVEIAFGPDGHGGLLSALAGSGALADMENHGVQSVFTFHVDNPLVPIADLEMLGHHLAAESEMSSLVIRKQSPQERVGNVVRNRRDAASGVFIIEYIDFPESLAEETTADGNLRYWAGSIGVHLINLDFLQKMQRALACNPMAVPWHFPLKEIKCDGRKRWAIKPERFLFDILPFARFPVIFEVDRQEAFATLKDDPAVVTEHLCGLYRKWLAQSGVHFSPDAVVEIAPSFAMNQHQLAQRLSVGQVLSGDEILLTTRKI